MTAEFEAKRKMYGGVHDVLQANESLWHDNPELLTELVAEFDAEAGALGAFGGAQAQTITGVTQRQNLAESALEDAAFPLARALRLYFRREKQLDKAAVWDMALTDWRKLRENELLDKAGLLHAALLPLTTGTTPAGQSYNITAAKVTAFGVLLADYAAVIGAPRGARSEHKAQTAELRPRFRVVDGILDDMDDLIAGLRGESAEHDHFVAVYEIARRIGGQSSGTAATSTTPATNP